MSNLYALLISIDHYFEYPLSNGVSYPRLSGASSDKSRRFTLSDNAPGAQSGQHHQTYGWYHLGGGPQEPKAQWPTYANMVNAFQQLRINSIHGDQVYIQYSGLVSTTMFPALKGDTGLRRRAGTSRYRRPR